MSPLNQLENEKSIILHTLKVKRINWKMEFVQDELAYQRYENYMNQFFPRSLLFKFITKYPAVPVLLFSFLTFKNTRIRFFRILKRLF